MLAKLKHEFMNLMNTSKNVLLPYAMLVTVEYLSSSTATVIGKLQHGCSYCYSLQPSVQWHGRFQKISKGFAQKQLPYRKQYNVAKKFGIQEEKQYISTKCNLALWKIKIDCNPYNSGCPYLWYMIDNCMQKLQREDLWNVKAWWLSHNWSRVSNVHAVERCVITKMHA